MSQTNGTDNPPQPGVELVIDKHIATLDELTGKLLRLTRDHFERFYGPKPHLGDAARGVNPCWGGIFGSWEERIGYSLGKLNQTIDEFNHDRIETLVAPELPPGFGCNLIMSGKRR